MPSQIVLTWIHNLQLASFLWDGHKGFKKRVFTRNRWNHILENTQLNVQRAYKRGNNELRGEYDYAQITCSWQDGKAQKNFEDDDEGIMTLGEIVPTLQKHHEPRATGR